jgi:hypothetical protein
MVADFIRNCEWGKHGYFWYDWLIRDCLKFIRTRVNGRATLPGTGEVISLGNNWSSKIDAAIQAAETACNYERDDLDILAGHEWQKIFGNRIPIRVR